MATDGEKLAGNWQKGTFGVADYYRRESRLDSLRSPTTALNAFLQWHAQPLGKMIWSSRRSEVVLLGCVEKVCPFSVVPVASREYVLKCFHFTTVDTT